MRPLQSLTLEALLRTLSTTCSHMPDPRRADRVTYSLLDTLMSGFAMMFFQHPRLLAFQPTMHQRRGRCHLETSFGVHEVPAGPQRRDLLDGVPVEILRPLLPILFAQLHRVGWATECQSPLGSGTPQDASYV